MFPYEIFSRTHLFILPTSNTYVERTVGCTAPDHNSFLAILLKPIAALVYEYKLADELPKCFC